MNNRGTHVASGYGRPGVPTVLTYVPNPQMGVFFDAYGNCIRSFSPFIAPMTPDPNMQGFVIPTVQQMPPQPLQQQQQSHKSGVDHFSGGQQPGAYPRKEASPFVPSNSAKPFVPGGSTDSRQLHGRQSYSGPTSSREKKILQIIDPDTGKDIIPEEQNRHNSTCDSAIDTSADLSSSDLSSAANLSKTSQSGDESLSAADKALLEQHRSQVVQEFHRKIADVALEKTAKPTATVEPFVVEPPPLENGSISILPLAEERVVSAKSPLPLSGAVKILRRDVDSQMTKPPPTVEVESPVTAEENKLDQIDPISPSLVNETETEAFLTVEDGTDDTKVADVKRISPIPDPENVIIEETLCESVEQVPEAIKTESVSFDISTPPNETSAESEEPIEPEEPPAAEPVSVEEKPAYLAAFDQLRKLRVTENIFNPETREGARVYSRDCVSLISKLPESLKDPQWYNKNELPDELFAERKSIQQPVPSYQRNFNLNQIKEDKFFSPNFISSPSAGGTDQQQQYNRRNYQQQPTKPYGGRGSFENRDRQPKKAPIVLRPSLNQKVELRTAENAWKPASKDTNVDADSDEAKTKALFKKVRGILNRITPQTFQDLVDEFLSQEISEEKVLRGVIDIFFDKAVEEPSYCALYGQLCHKVRANESSRAQDNKDSKSNFANFLLNKCQMEFEREKKFETIQKEKEDEIAATESPERRKELEGALEELLAKEKRRTLGTIRFIGELYQHGMLTGRIMLSCIYRLMNSQLDEEAVECLCKLLTTIGKKFESDPSVQGVMASFFPKFKVLSERTAFSSRTRFLVQDVVDLRNNGWESLRKNTQAGPKKLDELHNEIKMEKLQELIDLQEYDANKQGSPGGQRGNRAYYQGRRSTGNQDVRFNQDANSSRGDFAGRPQNYPKGGRGSAESTGGKVSQGSRRDSNQNDLGAEKVKQANLSQFNKDVVLRPGGGSWNKTAKATPLPTPATTNRFSSIADATENNAADIHPHGAEGLKHSVSCAVFNTATRESVSPVPPPESRAIGSIMKKPSDFMTEEKLELYARNLLDEVVNSKLLEEGIRLALERKNQLKSLVVFAFNHAIDSTNPAHRVCLGQLLGSLIKTSGVLSAILSGFTDFVDASITNEVQLDCPEIWTYVGSILAEIRSHTDAATLGRFLLKLCPDHAKDSVKELLRSSSSESLRVSGIDLLNGLATSLKESDLAVGNLWDFYRCLRRNDVIAAETFVHWKAESGEKFDFSVVFECSQARDFYGDLTAS